MSSAVRPCWEAWSQSSSLGFQSGGSGTALDVLPCPCDPGFSGDRISPFFTSKYESKGAPERVSRACAPSLLDAPFGSIFWLQGVSVPELLSPQFRNSCGAVFRNHAEI